MFVKFDFACRQCATVEERFVKKSEVDSQVCSVDSSHELRRLPAGTRTTYKFADARLKR